MYSFRSMCLVFVLSVFYLADAAPASLVSVDRAPNGKQYIPPLSGYIAVYIRPGDTPLENINTELAEAFRYYNRQNFVSVGRSLNEIQSSDQAAKLQNKKPRKVAKTTIGLDDVEDKEESKQKPNTQQEEGDKNNQNIQKIPKEA